MLKHSTQDEHVGIHPKSLSITLRHGLKDSPCSLKSRKICHASLKMRNCIIYIYIYIHMISVAWKPCVYVWRDVREGCEGGNERMRYWHIEIEKIDILKPKIQKALLIMRGIIFNGITHISFVSCQSCKLLATLRCGMRIDKIGTSCPLHPCI